MNNGKYNDGVTVNAILEAIRNGETVVRACELACISEETFYKWYRNNIEFSELVKIAKEEGRDARLERLEASLYQRATGYEAKETRTEYGTSPVDGKPIVVKKVVTTKNVAADTGALVFALTNVAPDKWKNKLNTEHSGEVGIPLQINVKDQEEKELIERARRM